MQSNSHRLLASVFAVALAACGAGAQSQSTTPAAVVVEPTAPAADPAAAGATDGTAAAKPRITALGPNITPDGVVFNHKAEGKNRQVYLAANFNNWNPSDAKFLMKDDDGDGIYTITVKLAPGTYQYKYVIDGQWTKDPYAPGDAPDGFGGRNGQFDVK